METMTLNDIFMYLGIFIVSIFVLYIINSIFKAQRSLVEGLANYGVGADGSIASNFSQILTSGSIDKLEKNSKVLEDGLYISKYKTQYENLIISMEDYINNLILANLLESANILTNGGKEDDLQKFLDTKIPQINELYKFKENLNASMDYLDKK
jgi:hypothetical protein